MRRAFTLIELLVVIAILGVLAGLLMPVLVNARKETMRKACLAQVRGIELALQAYKSDCGVFPADQCSNWTDAGTGETDVPASPFSWFHQLAHMGPHPYHGWQDQKLTAPFSDPQALPLDPWGRPYVYVLGPCRRGLGVTALFPGHPDGFNVFSLGPDRTCQSCGAFPGGADAHDGGGAAAGPQSQRHVGGKLPCGDDLGNW